MTEVFEDYVLLLYMTKACYYFFIFYYNINFLSYVVYVHSHIYISTHANTAKYILISIHILDNTLDMEQHRMKMGNKVNSS